MGVLRLAFSKSRMPCTTQGNSQWLNIIYFQANQKHQFKDILRLTEEDAFHLLKLTVGKP